MLKNNLKEKNQKLKNKIFNFLNDYSIKNNSYYNGNFNGISGKILGIYRGIKDGKIKLEKNDSLIEIHNFLSKPGEIINYEFFTPDIISKKLGSIMNEISGNDIVIDIGSGLGSTLKELNNGLGIEVNKDYHEILKDQGYNVLNIDISFDNLDKKYNFFYGNPPFGNGINKELFNFIYNNSTDDMVGVLLLPKNYNELLNKYGFKIIEQIPIGKEIFKNTGIDVEIYKIKKNN